MDVSTESVYQCRLCLSPTQTVVNIYEGDLIRMLEMLTSIKVHENDGLPRYSCSKCAEDVEIALSIKDRILKSHKTLLEIFENEKQLLRNLAEDIGSNGSVIIVNYDEMLNEDSETPTHEVVDELPVTKDENEVIIEYENLDGNFEEKSESDNSLGTEWCNSSDSGKSHRRKKCHVCRRFIRVNNFKRHIAGHGPDSKTKCPICERLITVTHIKKHIMLHSSNPSTCEICGVVYKNFESLRGHVFYQHKNSAEQYACEECGKSFRIKYKLMLHKKKAHTKIRNFMCETCRKKFFTKADLMAHMRITHEKLRPHGCEFCQSRFSSLNTLKNHRRQHTNEKPFLCEFCNNGFRHKVSLRSHLKSKHGVEEVKDFFCETCQKGFASSYALNIHERLHTSKKCPCCSETFDAEYLKTHLREKHNIVQES